MIPWLSRAAVIEISFRGVIEGGFGRLLYSSAASAPEGRSDSENSLALPCLESGVDDS